MNCVFYDLFNNLHNKECINDFDELVKFEDELKELLNRNVKLLKKKLISIKN